jgi:AraC-like DNA-binding protein
MEAGSGVQAVRFATGDADDFMERVAPVAPGFLVAPTARATRAASVEAVSAPRVSMLSVQPPAWRVLHDTARGFYSMSLILSGGLDLFEGMHCERIGVGQAQVLDLQRTLDLRTFPGSRYLIVNLDRELVDEFIRVGASSRCGVVAGARSVLRTCSGAGARFERAARRLAGTLATAGSAAASSPWLAEAEDELALLLVRAWLHGADEAGGGVGDSRSLSLASEYMAAHLDRPVSLAKVARAAGTSVRSLSRDFQRQCGVSPMRFLRMRRLDASNRDLLEAEASSTTVTAVALRYGWGHLGRFAGDYRRRFGESPSETLARTPRIYGVAARVAERRSRRAA